MKDYFRGAFRAQLGRLEYSEPSHVLRRALDLDGTVFFGGRDWNNAARDLARVPAADRVGFVLCLFMTVLNDQAVHACRPDMYGRWKNQTRSPKFGWSGFGIHNENPYKILWVPERDRLVDAAELVSAMPGFVRFYLSETGAQLAAVDPSLDLEAHTENIVHDSTYGFSEGLAVPAFRSALESHVLRRPEAATSTEMGTE